VRAVSTFDEARAACVARWGDPSTEWRYPDGEAIALWSLGGSHVGLTREADGRLRLWAVADGVPVPCWRIPDATPLPDALDAAVRWMAERAP
jgi:hypothetical protein